MSESIAGVAPSHCGPHAAWEDIPHPRVRARPTSCPGGRSNYLVSPPCTLLADSPAWQACDVQLQRVSSLDMAGQSHPSLS